MVFLSLCDPTKYFANPKIDRHGLGNVITLNPFLKGSVVTEFCLSRSPELGERDIPSPL